MKDILGEAITNESDLIAKLKPLSEADIFKFMQNLRGGTYFNMGMYTAIPVSRAYKNSIRIYKVISMTAIVSGTDYENVGTTKDFRDRTGKARGSAWYDHEPGYENKIAVSKKNPDSKYVLWNIKQGSGTNVRYFVVDLDTDTVTPVTKEDVLNSVYLTASEKKKMEPKKVEGYDKDTGALVYNETMRRTAAFEHIFYLSQAGGNAKEYGTKFTEGKQKMKQTDKQNKLAESVDIFADAHAGVKTNLDDILAGAINEEVQEPAEQPAGNTDGMLGLGKRIAARKNKKAVTENKCNCKHHRRITESYSTDKIYKTICDTEFYL